MTKISDYPVVSSKDLINAVKNWREENGEETTEAIVYFISELTGLSVDTIYENMLKEEK